MTLITAKGWTHGYDKYVAKLQAVPRGSQSDARNVRNQPTVMLGGDYSSIQNAERKQAKAQMDFYKKYGPHDHQEHKSHKSHKSHKHKNITSTNPEETNDQIKQIMDTPPMKYKNPSSKDVSVMKPQSVSNIDERNVSFQPISQVALPTNHEIIHQVMAS